MPTDCSKCNKIIKRNSDGAINCIHCDAVVHADCAKNSGNQNKSKFICDKCSPNSNMVLFTKALEKMKCDVDGLAIKQQEYLNNVASLSGSLKELQELGLIVAANCGKLNDCTVKIKNLENEIEYIQKRARERNVVITGIPMKNSENILEIVLSIAKVLKVEIKKESIEKYCRFQAKSGGEKPILITFRCIQDRIYFISAFKLKKGITATEIGYSGSFNVHIGEHLTQKQHTLLVLAKRDLVMYGFKTNQFLYVKMGMAKYKKSTQKQTFND